MRIDVQGNLHFTFSITSLIIQSLFLMGNFYQDTFQAFEQGGQEQTMARITVEDCLNNVDNRFQLIHLAAKRVRQLKKGAAPMVVCKNKDIVVALREIAAGDVFQIKKGQAYDRIEAPPETDTVFASEEGLLTENRDDLPDPEMDASEEGEDVLDPEMDETEEAEEEK